MLRFFIKAIPVLVVFGLGGFFLVAMLQNPFRTPQEIHPAQEISCSATSIDLGGASFAVPHGWEIEKLLRFDDLGRPLTAYMVRKANPHRKAFMCVEILDEQPSWTGNAEVSRSATANHGIVTFDITDSQPPSGDDTPGRYTLHAFVEQDCVFLYLYVTFFTPVLPELKDAVYYVDGFQFPATESL